MRAHASALVALLLLACGPDHVERLDEVGDEHSTSESSSDSTSESSETDEGACIECLITVTQTDCVLDLHQTPTGIPNPQQIPYVEVEHDGTLVPYVDDCAREDGWTWLVDGEIPSLCGSWCLMPADAFDVCYGCPPAGTPWPKCETQRELPLSCLAADS